MLRRNPKKPTHEEQAWKPAPEQQYVTPTIEASFFFPKIFLDYPASSSLCFFFLLPRSLRLAPSVFSSLSPRRSIVRWSSHFISLLPSLCVSVSLCLSLSVLCLACPLTVCLRSAFLVVFVAAVAAVAAVATDIAVGLWSLAVGGLWFVVGWCVVCCFFLLSSSLLFVVCCCWMVNYSKRISVVRSADISEFFQLIFVCQMCVFVSPPMKIDTFPRKNSETPNWFLIFLGKTHIPNNHGNRRGFPQQRQTLEIEEDLSVEPNLQRFRIFIFSVFRFSFFLHFFFSFVFFFFYYFLTFFHLFFFFYFSFYFFFFPVVREKFLL